jgi:hypothetical protein
MSDVPNSNGVPADAKATREVLASLPRTRPQRPSPRRARARALAAKGIEPVAMASKAKPATSQPKTKAKPVAQALKPRTKPVVQALKARTKPKPVAQARTSKSASAKAAASAPKSSPRQSASRGKTASARRAGRVGNVLLSVPRQGFESEPEIQVGRSVRPPSGTELVASAAEIAGELAQAGLSAGGRVLKGALVLSRFSRLGRP